MLRFRARATHLDERLAREDLARAAHGGLQDSAPRAGVISLHARVHGCEPDSWDDPSLAQIWFRGGADYVIPRADIGVFTLGSMQRDPDVHPSLDAVADAAHEVLQGRVLTVREVSSLLDLDHPFSLRLAARTGRLLIRWNATNIWLIRCERPDIDVEDARRELARRFLSRLGPQSAKRFAWWTMLDVRDVAPTFAALEPELVTVEVDGEERLLLERDLDALRRAEPVPGVRLVPADDPFIKFDHELLVPDASLRARIFPPASLGYIPGAILLDGEIAGVWQRRQRRVTIHPWRKLPEQDVEREALSFPIASRTKSEVRWAD